MEKPVKIAFFLLFLPPPLSFSSHFFIFFLFLLSRAPFSPPPTLKKSCSRVRKELLFLDRTVEGAQKIKSVEEASFTFRSPPLVKMQC